MASKDRWMAGRERAVGPVAGPGAGSAGRARPGAACRSAGRSGPQVWRWPHRQDRQGLGASGPLARQPVLAGVGRTSCRSGRRDGFQSHILGISLVTSRTRISRQQRIETTVSPGMGPAGVRWFRSRMLRRPICRVPNRYGVCTSKLSNSKTPVSPASSSIATPGFPLPNRVSSISPTRRSLM